MTSATRVPKIVFLKKQWHLSSNPFPSEAIAHLGGEDARLNGQLFNPDVQPDAFAEAAEKFVLGTAYSGLKFGFLWSLGTGVGSDARGFGKSVLMQHLVERVNEDFGREVFKSFGLDENDADENTLCAVLASFDMANARSLNAVFYEAARYACRYRSSHDRPTLAERVRQRLVTVVGSEKQSALVSAVDDVQANLRGRTLGPPEAEFLALLCGSDPKALQAHVDAVTATKRTRSGAIYLATFLLMARAAGIRHVLLCCDQLEDFASTNTTRQKRELETERFRDYIFEIQPMSDMLSCVVTMHPRATQAIGPVWQLADLPSYDYTREENRHRVVVLERIQSSAKAAMLMQTYLSHYRTNDAPAGQPLFPFTQDAVATLFARSDGKPRNILRKAYALIEAGAEQNWELIDGDRATQVLDSFTDTDEDGLTSPGIEPSRADLWAD